MLTNFKTSQFLSVLLLGLALSGCSSTPPLKYSYSGAKNVSLTLNNATDVFSGQLVASLFFLKGNCEWIEQGQLELRNHQVETISVPLNQFIMVSFDYSRSNYILSSHENMAMQFVFEPKPKMLYQIAFDLDSRSFDIDATSRRDGESIPKPMKSEKLKHCRERKI